MVLHCSAAVVLFNVLNNLLVNCLSPDKAISLINLRSRIL